MKDFAYFCPACGTSSVESSMLAGGAASCAICHWEGKREELLALPLEHQFSGQEEMLKTFITQLSNVMSKSAAMGIGRVLLQWGFITLGKPEETTEELKKYIRAMMVAAAGAVIETRRQLEVVKMNKTRAQNDNN